MRYPTAPTSNPRIVVERNEHSQTTARTVQNVVFYAADEPSDTNTRQTFVYDLPRFPRA